jgi:alanyl-tRNA synthetase
VREEFILTAQGQCKKNFLLFFVQFIISQKSEYMMTAQELREKYLKFFQSKGHTIIPSASLVPENDPSVLFTTAGMHPLVPYLMGEKHPAGKRLVNVQKCIRTGDIDEVGDRTHHTFFEMLGNWSLGDYFKEESIRMSWEFLTSADWLNLDKNRIAVSVFEGDADSPFDQDAYNIWKNLGISEKKIAKLPKKNNWWGMENGPCGPDTEIFFWTGNLDEIPESFNDDNDQWVEIWNNVFMQYDKKPDGVLEALKQKNVDTGMGMERILAAVNGFEDNYRTELFLPIINKIKKVSGKNYADNKKSFRVIADHIKSATFIIGDEKEIITSNVGQGYIVRRLLRRAIRHGKMIGIENNFIKQISQAVIEVYRNVYVEIEKNKERIFIELEKEENKFRNTLDKGLKEFKNQELRIKNQGKKKIDKEVAFNLYQTYGFPLEMTVELAKENELSVDIDGFNEELKKHQELSRTASAGKFKGGLADAGEETVKLHTAAHLFLAALREVLGEETYQKGSNITAERLRFDFNYPEKLTDEQIKKVEDLVNQKIQENIPVEMTQMPKNEALKNVKISFDPSKYGDMVKVYSIGNFSSELCGGPHAENTGELGKFKIKKEESSGAGVRRIKATLE